MKKITSFRDVPQFTRDGHYRVNYPIHHIIDYIDEEVETQGLQLNPDFQRGRETGVMQPPPVTSSGAERDVL